jgi:subtilisin family serine protease
MPSRSRLLAATTVGLVTGVLAAQAANDGGAAQLWNMRTIGAEAAWATGTGKGITIAVVDTGVHATHEDLAGRLVPGRNFVTDGAPPQDDNGHGTHVAGIAAATANNRVGVFGVAPEARIMPVRVLHGPDGRGVGEDVEAGIRWAADNGAHVINLSLGEDLQGLPLFGPGFADSVEYAFRKGAICVVAAGNDSLRSSGFTADTNALIVTATTPDDTQADYASDVGAFLNGTPKWGMAAPGGASTDPPDGDDILSTFWTSSNANDQYAWAAGTSMAAPHVAGAAAILRGLGLSAEQAAQRLASTAKDVGRAGPDNTYGHGRLDVAKAVAGLQPAGGSPNPSGAGGSGSGGGSGGGAGAAGGGGSGTAGSSGSTVTTARSGPSRGGAGGAGAGPTSTTAAGAEGTAPDEPAVVSLPAGDDGTDETAAPPQRRNDGGHDDTVWPAALLALAALAGAAAGAVRLRRLRV